MTAAPQIPPCTGAQWRVRELTLLRQLVQRLDEHGSPDPVLCAMLARMAELLGLERSRIVLPAPDGAPARIAMAHGLDDTETARGIYAPGEGVTGLALACGRPVLVPDIDADPRFLARSVDRAALPGGPLAFLALPIQWELRTVGVLACHRSRRSDRPLEDDMALLRVLAALAGQRLRPPTPAALVRGYLPATSHSAEELERVLALHDGRQARAARALGLSLRQFGYRLRKARAVRGG